MKRARIQLPAEMPFTTEIPVTVNLINYGGHLGNDSVLAMMHEARIRFLAERGLSETDAGGAALIMADAVISFKGQAYLGDLIQISIAVDDITNNGFNLYYHLIEKNSKRDIAMAKTALAAFDYKRSRVCKVPPALAETLK